MNRCACLLAITAIALLAASLGTAAGTHCVTNTSTLQTALAAEASIASGTSTLRFASGTISNELVLTQSVPGTMRTVVIDGGWNASCTARVTGGRTTIPRIALRASYPNSLQSAQVTVQGMRVGDLELYTAIAGSRTLRDNHITPGAGDLAIVGTPLVVERNQVFGGQLYFDTVAGTGDLRITNNELRDVARLRIAAASQGTVLFRNNTVLLRNLDGMTNLGVGYNIVETLTNSGTSTVDISNNLIGRSVTYDVFTNASVSVSVANLDGSAPASGVVRFLGNMLQTIGNGVALGSPNIEAALGSPAHRNIVFSSALPFDARPQAPYLVPDAGFAGINQGVATTLADDSTDLRGRARHVGAAVDVGAHESDVLFASGME